MKALLAPLPVGIYFLLNLYAFILMGRDKYFARKNKWRIPEAWLFLLAFIGGALGVWLGMQVFRHKTKQKRFVYGIPALLFINIGLILGLQLNMV